jgi:uncharacterized protein
MQGSLRRAWFVLVGLLLVAACRDSKPLPPGDWLGRCAASAQPSATEFGPPPTKFVRDSAGRLPKAFAADLERTLSQFQLESCHQLTVAVVASLEGSTLDDYARDYANRIGLGYRRLNNGLLLVLAPNTRQARIQIGCGLEDVVSDAQAREILQRDLLPAFGEGDAEQAIRASVASLMKLARKKTIDERFRPEGCRQRAGASGT